ncbi:hypothetical protein C4K39_2551 [Pseudomonas sessilinigenes]|nr:hypothetical protein C4K40_2574 [Pseudomonas sp. CMR5c]AZC24225.1 hypothetical protein C4K39_2551 [Pseudomonas sessilinigenes]
MLQAGLRACEAGCIRLPIPWVQWRVECSTRLPLRGQHRTCPWGRTGFPFHLTHGGVRHLKQGGI